MTAAPLALPVIGSRISHSWLDVVDLALITECVGTPAYIYSERQLCMNIERISAAARAVGLEERVKLYIPFFPNSNPHVLRALQGLGVGLLVQLPNEYEVLSRHGFRNFIVSPGYVSDSEIDLWAMTSCPVFLSSLDEVSHALQIDAPTISVRIDSLNSDKPGIKYDELGRLCTLLARHHRDLESFEVYCGSGNSTKEMIGPIETLFSIYTDYFPTARSIDFAGGFGFDYDGWHSSMKHFNWCDYFEALRVASAKVNIPGHVAYLFEPARDVLADIGVLLLSVKRDVITNSVTNVVVTDGSRMLMPSAQLRGRRHNVGFLDASMTEIFSADGLDGVSAAIRGRSILRHDYVLPGEYWVPTGVGSSSYIVIMDVGAYCATQHMEFLNIPPAAEVLVDMAGAAHLITERGNDLDKWRHVLPRKKLLLLPESSPIGNAVAGPGR